MKSTLILISAATILSFACARKPDMVVTAASTQPAPEKTAIQASALPAGHPDINLAANKSAQPPSAAPAGTLTGKVLETMNAGGYTYLKIDTAQGPVWAAVREFKTQVGATVSVNAEMTMENFESNSLHRKFDRIVFGSLGGPATAAPAQPGSMMSGSSPMGTPQQHMAAAANIGDVKVAKAEGPNAKTVAELWAGKDALKGKTVVVRGKVVKSLSGIMGKNWIHLRDGSGSRANGSDDITVTTNGTASVGDVVVVTGVVNTDKDFGAGYLYPVIIEDAKVTK